MTELVARHEPAPGAIRRAASDHARLVWLSGTFAVAAFAGIALGHVRAADPAGFEPALALLLHFMAACKAACALGAAALVAWRLGLPLPSPVFAGYLAALVPMAAAPGLIWSLGLIAPGALLFHAGLIAFLVLAARDEGVSVPRRRHG